MSKISKIIFGILILALAGGGWFLLKGQKADDSRGVAAKEIWFCPMHPHYTSDRPGNCPICGMTLVKKQPHSNDEKSNASILTGHSSITLDIHQRQMLGIKTVAVERQILKKTIRAPGYISTNHELYEMQNQYIEAYISYVTKYRDVKRFEHARRNWDTHRDVQLKLHEAEDQLLRLGLSMDKIKKLQDVSWKKLWDQPELLLFKEGTDFWVVAQIFESDLGFVDAGQGVEIEIPAYSEKIKGIIRSVGGILDPQSRTAKMLVELTGYRGELSGNMFVNVTIQADLNAFLIVPQAAVMDTGLRKIVYVEVKDGIFQPRNVIVGPRGDNGWAVKSGLHEGEQVAIEGNFLLDSESRLQASIAGEGVVSGEYNHGQ